MMMRGGWRQNYGVKFGARFISGGVVDAALLHYVLSVPWAPGLPFVALHDVAYCLRFAVTLGGFCFADHGLRACR